MTKLEEQQYYDKFFDNLGRMSESEANEYLSHLNEAAIIHALKSQVRSVNRGMNRQNTAITEIKEIMKKKGNSANPEDQKLADRIKRLDKLFNKFMNAAENEVGAKAMDRIAEKIDANTSLTGKDKADAEFSFKDVRAAGKEAAKAVKKGDANDEQLLTDMESEK